MYIFPRNLILLNSIPYPLPKNTRQSHFLKYGNSFRGKASQKNLGCIVKGSQKPMIFRFKMVDFLLHTIQGLIGGGFIALKDIVFFFEHPRDFGLGI